MWLPIALALLPVTRLSGEPLAQPVSGARDNDTRPSLQRPFVLLTTSQTRSFGSKLAALWLAAFLPACGDDAECPAGTAGSPCRYTIGVGDAPSVPQGSDAVSGGDSDAFAPDPIDADDDAAEGMDVDDDGLDDSSGAEQQTPNQDAAAGSEPTGPARTASSTATRPSEATAPEALQLLLANTPERPVARVPSAGDRLVRAGA